MRPKLCRIMTVASAAALSACANEPPRTHAPIEPRYSGFLGDYTHMEPSPRHPGTMYEQKRSLARYTAFMVEPIRVLADQTLGGAPIDDATKQRLSRDLYNEVVETLRINYKVVDKPGPGVGVIRGAITQLARSRQTPGGVIVIGGAGVEAEIVDGVTGERLGAVVEADAAEGLLDPRTKDPYQDARLVFRHWAARLNLWLQSAEELGTD